MSAPGSAKPRAVRFVPLGGLGEIGMNCMLVEQSTGGGGRERILIDCGVTFPRGDYGVDVIHPRYDHILDAPEALSGIILTHGHEDHIGGLPYLLRALEAEGVRPPVYGPPYALGLVRRRLEEHELPADLREVAVREPYTVGSIGVEHIHVTHSIAQATAVALETRAGRVVHTGDFKLDPHPRDGILTDAARLRELGDAGVDLLLSDSTNVLKPGRSGSERTVAAALDAAFDRARGRIAVGLFASNLYRLDAVAQAAQRHRRRLCLLGRSIRNHADLGRYLGLLDWPSDLLARPETAARLPPERVAYAAGGTQGEFRGSLRRLAYRTHHEARLDEGDTVVMSARVIPGNERLVTDLINAFLRDGVDVVFRATHPDVHVSGHGHRDELGDMIDWLRPRHFVPVHGTRMHLEHHAALARGRGVERALVVENGQAFALDEAGLHHADEVVVGRVGTARRRVLDDATVAERRRLGRHGVVFVRLALDGSLDGVASRGVPDADHARRVVGRAVRWAGADRRAPRDHDGLSRAERVRRVVRGKLGDALGQRPGGGGRAGEGRRGGGGGVTPGAGGA
ncbi:MAG: ribonuclease J, partial [Myxococcota bacterium]